MAHCDDKQIHGADCCCGNHEHHHEADSTCICGHDHKAEGGVGHDRSMGRIFFALVGGLLTLNSYLLSTFLPEQAFASQMSALLGAFILALPIIWVAVKDLVRGKVYMNELVALAILAALALADFQSAGLIAFFLLVTIITTITGNIRIRPASAGTTTRPRAAWVTTARWGGSSSR